MKKSNNHNHNHSEHESTPLKSTAAQRPQVLFVLVLLMAAIGTFVVYKSRAAGDTLSLVPSSSSVSLGSTVTVTIHENSNTDAVNAVEADLTYDQTKLQFVSIDTSTSAFSLSAAGSGGNGTVSIARATSTPVTGDQVVANVTFNALGAGTTPVNFATSSALVRASDTTNVLAATAGGTYTIADTTAPTVPTGLTSPSQTVTSVNLSWTASTDNVGVVGYKIYRNGSANPINTSTTTSYSDTGLSPGTSYSYTVAAYDAAGNTSAKSSALATATLPDTTAPSVPIGLTMSSRTLTSISLTWTASTDNVAVTGYKVFRNGTQVNTVSSPAYTDTGLTPGTNYSYTISAFDASNNNSAQSTASQFATLPDTTAPSVPTGLTSPSQTTNSITLNWTASTDNVGVTGYKVFRNGTQVNTTTTNSYTDTSLSSGVSYSYTISAFDAAGNNSAQSTASSFTTLIKAGDVNGDGSIDIFDLSILATNYGQCGKTRSLGDLNGDGCVNVFDLSLLASNWGK